MTTNVTVELETTRPFEELADLFPAELADDYGAALHASWEDPQRAAVTLTVPQAAAVEAVRVAVRLVRRWLPVGVYAVSALPTDEFDRRAGSGSSEAGHMTVPEAAGHLGISQQRVRQLLGTPGGLEGVKVGRDWLVTTASVRARGGA